MCEDQRNASRYVQTFAVVLFLLTFGASTYGYAPNAQAAQTCACGDKRVLLLLADFQDFRHISNRAEISRLFFGQVSRYFQDVSYGKLTVSGNVTDWVTLPRLYEQYALPGQKVDIAGVARDSLLASAQDYNMSSFDYYFLVLSFYQSLTADYTPLQKPVVTRSGTIDRIVVVEEDRDWSDYARGLAFSLGLWGQRDKVTALGQFDILSGGQGDMSAWSKLDLGWINDTQVPRFSSFTASRIVTLTPIEETEASNFALIFDVGHSEGQYFVEARQPIGYDKNTLQEYGVLVLFVPSGNGSITFRTIMQPNNVGKSVFLDTAADFSIVVLNQTKSYFYLLVGSVEEGRDAQRTLYAIARASDAIQVAISGNRIEGLDLADKLLRSAQSLFSAARFREAEALALSAETTANSANIPSDYYDSVQLITSAEELKGQVQHLTSPQSIALVEKGSIELETAKAAFIAKNFTLAKEKAQAAINLFNQARQLDFTELVFEWLSDLALLVPIAILAYALRYQLRSR